ncbi:MAG TPA: nucleotidyltransferase domain-containing protein, partial [Caulobacteraceae bacterium]|nr:nucleotidyltransferase domain-containing protein [Caulobacteraceae bacterium]
MASASASSDGEAAFAALADLARRDDDILAFWLGGSRGKGRATVHSDYDCALVVRDEVRNDFARRHAG